MVVTGSFTLIKRIVRHEFGAGGWSGQSETRLVFSHLRSLYVRMDYYGRRAGWGRCSAGAASGGAARHRKKRKNLRREDKSVNGTAARNAKCTSTNRATKTGTYTGTGTGTPINQSDQARE